MKKIFYLLLMLLISPSFFIASSSNNPSTSKFNDSNQNWYSVTARTEKSYGQSYSLSVRVQANEMRLGGQYSYTVHKVQYNDGYRLGKC